MYNGPYLHSFYSISVEPLMHNTAMTIFNHLRTYSTSPGPTWRQQLTQLAPRSDAKHTLTSLKAQHTKDTPPVCGHHTQLPCTVAISLTPNSQYSLTQLLPRYSTALQSTNSLDGTSTTVLHPSRDAHLHHQTLERTCLRL